MNCTFRYNIRYIKKITNLQIKLKFNFKDCLQGLLGL